MTCSDTDSAFYRDLSSQAAQEALAIGSSMTQQRCASSANFWCSLADAIDAGDEGLAAILTHNLTFMPTRRVAPVL